MERGIVNTLDFGTLGLPYRFSELFIKFYSTSNIFLWPLLPLQAFQLYYCKHPSISPFFSWPVLQKASLFTQTSSSPPSSTKTAGWSKSTVTPLRLKEENSDLLALGSTLRWLGFKFCFKKSNIVLYSPADHNPKPSAVPHTQECSPEH